MNVIFVDIDGPLLPGKMHMFHANRKTGEKFAMPYFDPWGVRCFNVWAKYSQAKIVFSTNWTHHWPIEKLQEAMEFNGLEFDYHNVVATPRRFTSSRSTEILDWLEDNTDVEGDRFIAVDDDTTCANIRTIIDDGNRNIHITGDWIPVDFMDGISWEGFQKGCELLGIDMEDIKEQEFGIKKLTEEEKAQRLRDLEILANSIV